MRFIPDDISVSGGDMSLVVSWAKRQFQRLTDTMSQPNYLILPQYHIAPDKPWDGMLIYADGSDWNPGSGRGFYRYDSATSAWVYLG